VGSFLLGYIKCGQLLYWEIISFSKLSLFHGIGKHILDYQALHQVSEVTRQKRLALGIMSDKRREVLLLWWLSNDIQRIKNCNSYRESRF
jgi:hypothetical protein